jgi:hypothetical protein
MRHALVHVLSTSTCLLLHATPLLPRLLLLHPLRFLPLALSVHLILVTHVLYALAASWRHAPHSYVYKGPTSGATLKLQLESRYSFVKASYQYLSSSVRATHSMVFDFLVILLSIAPAITKTSGVVFVLSSARNCILPHDCHQLPTTLAPEYNYLAAAVSNPTHAELCPSV